MASLLFAPSGQGMALLQVNAVHCYPRDLLGARRPATGAQPHPETPEKAVRSIKNLGSLTMSSFLKPPSGTV